MPLFDYVCHKCGRKQEILQPLNGVNGVPTCCSYLMEKLPSAPAFTIGGYNAKNGYAKEGA